MVWLIRISTIVRLSVAFIAEPAPASDALNVLFIASDDLRNDLGCYGHPYVKTPHLDRLASRGLVFNNAYCQQALCNPSRASIMTGRRVDSLKIWDLPTHFRERFPKIVTLPQHFRQAGYFTQNIGKIFHNWRQAFEGDPDSWSVPAAMHFNTHYADVPQLQTQLPDNSARAPKCECRDVPDNAYFDGRIADLAIDALEQRRAVDKPFFLAVGFWKPHSPFNAPKKYWDIYDRERIAMPVSPDWPINTPRIAWHDSREILESGAGARQLTNEELREIRHGYLANISYLDAQIGRVLETLDRLQLTSKTVVVFWSDHGYHLGEHSLYAKTSNFELDARVPLIISMPNSGGVGRRTDAIVELMDLYPTLNELCGLEPTEGTEGVSLVPILNAPEAEVRQSALTQHPRPAYFRRDRNSEPTHMGYSVRTANFRYTEWRAWQTGETTARELYDHTIDPNETRNLVDEKDKQAVVHEHAEILSRMKPLVRPGWNEKADTQ